MNQLKVIANEMLPVYQNENGEKFVNARELHEQMLVGKVFAAWIQERIEKYGFIEREDFFPVSEKTNGRPKVEYWLTLDTAKEVAMVQNNEAGRAIRKYFIEVEKRFRQQQAKSPAELIYMLAQQNMESERRMSQLQQQVTTVQHRLDNYDRIDTIGDLQQRLNKMIRRYAHQEKMTISSAWRAFTDAFNTAYKTNLKLRITKYKEKHGLKDLTRPQYLSMTNQLEDAVRVADKLLNKGSATA
ncbi:antA/AntB antirepressor family protein [Bacillus thuringiensis]|uniref:antA/AntB antirepressor family protein n=1 Tax=Bacillus thuringiensis TaxID=1428 RepID=UPI002D7EC99D|nr:antA/AntB antirepressor family protein [Bacillus thuringiensis]MEB4894889.1 antA/AntB antirepressor family protein [Bacillus thuringiensis]MEC2565340.1 antA/AntB antirepressor family protein [Bacillus thuringiensis]MEC2643802.1 antA/AntB antirepressor family protein [Bacillus thuringiensis]MEC2727793.1 antA/AntB antirepressor family protein [Bacillus thuringiensis]MEC2752087.1 antA/AntB antirepressor family protein [Bacillus thuringiensis]